MKKVSILIVMAFVLSLALVTSPFAAGQQSGAQMGKTSMEQAHRANNIMGKDVMSQGGEKLGKVEDLVIDRQGQVAFVVLSSADDNKLRPVLFKSLSADPQKDQLTANIDKQKFSNAPSFEKGEWEQAMSPQWESNVYGYYGEEAPAGGGTMMHRPGETEMPTTGTETKE